MTLTPCLWIVIFLSIICQGVADQDCSFETFSCNSQDCGNFGKGVKQVTECNLGTDCVNEVSCDVFNSDCTQFCLGVTQLSATCTSAPTSCPFINDQGLYCITNGPTASPNPNFKICDQGVPTSQPTSTPSRQPTSIPSRQPTSEPTSQPSSQPTSSQPTSQPTYVPSSQPTTQPTSDPTFQPTSEPTQDPRPTFLPSSQPTSQPTSKPTPHPGDPPPPKPDGDGGDGEDPPQKPDPLENKDEEEDCDPKSNGHRHRRWGRRGKDPCKHKHFKLAPGPRIALIAAPIGAVVGLALFYKWRQINNAKKIHEAEDAKGVLLGLKTRDGSKMLDSDNNGVELKEMKPQHARSRSLMIGGGERESSKRRKYSNMPTSDDI